ncbi:MAG: glycine--tRNA ligase [Candidatus Altiarchaeota archaeon]|nr:glycine--tRNA ligase [Candidatus Altiarchaeota archaeon]
MYEDILDVSKRRGIVYPSFEIYGGVSGFYDYGPIGARIKQNIEDLLRRHYVVEEGCMEVQCPTLSPEDVWIASGHVKSFSDYTTECVKCNEPYRADHLIESELKTSVDGKTVDELKEMVKQVKCPKCKGAMSDIYNYNLMFQTSVGPGKSKITAYLRPETAQSTYLAFNRLWEYARRTLPFGVIQIGHSYRNEISPRQGMIRLREFNQCEIQYFMNPDNKSTNKFDKVKDMKVKIKDKNEQELEMTLGEACEKGVIKIQFIAYNLGKAMKAFTDMGISPERLKMRQHRDDERAFYSSDTWDVEYVSESLGKIELVGIADRTDYDLSAHMKQSKKAPYIAGVFSLVKKDGLQEKTDGVFNTLKDAGLYVLLDHAGSIGKRYARADEIGVPYSITIDYDTMKDDTVTVRDRDTKEQKRVPISELIQLLR